MTKKIKMKRIEANMRKKCEASKIELKTKMFQSALQSARLESEEKKLNADAKLQKAMEELSETSNVKNVLKTMVDCFNDKKDAEAEIELADELEKYLEEEIEVEEEETKCK